MLKNRKNKYMSDESFHLTDGTHISVTQMYTEYWQKLCNKS